MNAEDATVQPEDLDLDGACAVLGVTASASASELRAAYLEAVKAHPPDRDPLGFQRVKRAQELLADPRVALRHRLQGDVKLSLPELLARRVTPRRPRGADWWLARLLERKGADKGRADG